MKEVGAELDECTMVGDQFDPQVAAHNGEHKNHAVIGKSRNTHKSTPTRTVTPTNGKIMQQNTPGSSSSVNKNGERGCEVCNFYLFR